MWGLGEMLDARPYLQRRLLLVPHGRSMSSVECYDRLCVTDFDIECIVLSESILLNHDV